MSSTLTKRALEQSLKRLLATKPLAKITIADITEDCGISRMTFYYHFKDIYDLVEWCLEEDAASVLNGAQTVETWQEGYLAVLSEVQQNKAFITTIYREMSRERVERFCFPRCEGWCWALSRHSRTAPGQANEPATSSPISTRRRWRA